MGQKFSFRQQYKSFLENQEGPDKLKTGIKKWGNVTCHKIVKNTRMKEDCFSQEVIC